MYVHVHVLYMICTCTTCTGIIISTSIIITSISTNIHTVWTCTCTCNLYSMIIWDEKKERKKERKKDTWGKWKMRNEKWVACIAQVHVLIYSQLSKCLDMVAYTLYVGWPAKNGHQYISIDIMFDTFINYFTVLIFIVIMK